MSTELNPTKSLYRLPVFVFVACLAVAAGYFVSRSDYTNRSDDAAGPSKAETLPEILAKAPSFNFTSATGAPFSSSQLAGEIWLMNFFFASCPGPCPLINTELKKIRTTPWLRDKVRLVSLTVDPARDTPQRLNEYAKRYAANPGEWDFITGSEADTRALIEGGFKLIAPDDVSLHTTRIVLVDRNGDIRGFYQGTDQDSLKQMFRDVSALVRNDPSQR